MVQVYELRVLERFAHLVFEDEEGERMSTLVRKVKLEEGDPRLEKIGALQRDLAETGEAFFAGWEIHRRYSTEERQNAELLHLAVVSVFEPPAEDFGTAYDEGSACSNCGAGGARSSPLILDPRRVPKRDLSRTIAGEIVASARFVELCRRESITGVSFQPVFLARTSPLVPSEAVQEPVVTSEPVEIVPPTRVGTNPFSRPDDSNGACPKGDLLGLNLLSELWISASTRGMADVVATRQYVGVRRGDLRPARCLLVSPRMARLLVRKRMTGFKLEVAHLVRPTRGQP